MSNTNGSPSADDVFNSIDMLDEFSYVTIDSNDCLFWPSSEYNTDVSAAVNESHLKTSNDPIQLHNCYLSQCSKDTTNSDQLESVINETIFQSKEFAPLVNYQEYSSNDASYALSPGIPALSNIQPTTDESNRFTYQMSNYVVGKLRNMIYVRTVQLNMRYKDIFFKYLYII